MNKVKVGVIGLGQRGVELLSTMLFCEEADIVAVCDVYPDRVQKAIEQVQKERHTTPVGYDDYRKVLADREVQMTVISTSWQTHVRIAVDSMKSGKVTAVEVSGAYDIEDCWQLVRTYEETRTLFWQVRVVVHRIVSRGQARHRYLLPRRIQSRLTLGNSWRRGQSSLPLGKLQTA